MPLAALAALLLVLLTLSPASAQAPPTDPEKSEAKPPIVELPGVTVIGTTPLPALGIPVEKYPGNVQSLTAEDVAGRNTVDLSDTLFRRLGPVNVTGGQSNPWQNDVTYRGSWPRP
jgi:hypothetical protein